MSTTQSFLSSQISVFNPGRLSDEEIERIFITRKGVFQYLFDLLVGEKPGSIPQHHLIVGERGMGKSTLLHRLAVEFRKPPYRDTFLPLTFPEEQYNIDRLSKFWLNCLDALADALDRAGEQAQLTELDADIDRWQKQAKNIPGMEMYGHFEAWSKRLNRRPILLVDNLNLIFNKISKEEQHQLRAILMKNGAPILVGASAHSIDDVVDYGAPFYDAFKIQTLKKLSFDEVMDTLRNLAEITNNLSFVNEIYVHRGRLRALYQLTGGTPRTLTMLYPLIREGFSVNVQTDLEALMDMATSLYKARFEELPDQMQVVLDAIAMHWDPVNIEQLRELTHLENAQISPQIKRLYDTGWIARIDTSKAKGNTYEISERFFSYWYLLRRSNRRKKRDIIFLTRFLETMYEDEIPEMAQQMLATKLTHPDQAGLCIAMAEAITDEKISKHLMQKGYRALLNMSARYPELVESYDSFKLREPDMDTVLLNGAQLESVSSRKDNEQIENNGLLNAIKAMQDKNFGIASNAIAEYFGHDSKFNYKSAATDLSQFAAIVVMLGYGHEVLSTLEKTGHNIILRPYYEAIKALGEKDSMAYLNSVAVEVREPAAMIMEKIKRYM
jgi:hypothetical protein